MAIIQLLIAALARSAGRLLNTAFGWATVMVFGKVPADRQIYLSVLGFGSVLWILAVVGIAFPSAGTFLLSFVPLPDWVSRTWVRLAMLAAALILPALVGATALLLKDPARRPRGAAATARVVLKGYPFTLGLALTLVTMTILAPLRKLQTLARRWEGQHVPVLIDADDYDVVVGEVQRALAAAGWETERRPATWMLRLPTRILTGLAGGGLESLVAERLTSLVAPGLEVVLHPSDLAIRGRAADVVDARATLAEQLAFSRAHLTWTKEANEVEDGLRAVAVGAAPASRLPALHREIRRLDLAFEEWEVLFRTALLAERAAGNRAGSAAGSGTGFWPRLVAPLGAALVGHAVTSPRIRDALDRLVVDLLEAGRRRAAIGSGPAAPPRAPDPRARPAA